MTRDCDYEHEQYQDCCPESIATHEASGYQDTRDAELTGSYEFPLLKDLPLKIRVKERARVICLSGLERFRRKYPDWNEWQNGGRT